VVKIDLLQDFKLLDTVLIVRQSALAVPTAAIEHFCLGCSPARSEECLYLAYVSVDLHIKTQHQDSAYCQKASA
jgi:hypothetical protein